MLVISVILTAPLTGDFCVVQIFWSPTLSKRQNILDNNIRDNSQAELLTVHSLTCVCVSSCALDSYGSFPGKVWCQYNSVKLCSSANQIPTSQQH